MIIFNPIKGEEWIEEFRTTDFWIVRKRSYQQKFYARLCNSYLGWWFYFRSYSVWSRLGLLIDPLSCGGLWSHIRSFLFNAVVVDMWWRTKHKVWKIFHRREHQQQIQFMDACIQATQEGFTDPMPNSPGFEKKNFHGASMGKRYFKRVIDILRERRK